MSKKELEHLTDEQYFVTQQNGTEKPFENKFWNYFEQGIYVDIVSGEPLFSSQHKFESTCGWPSFYRALAYNNIVKIDDFSHGVHRVEVRSKQANSHLGHLFNDGPAPTGIRYCINSAALQFVPKDKLAQLGYSDYLAHFESKQRCESASIMDATFGAGCFWGVEAIFKGVEGVVSVTSGYSGGDLKNPTYQDICTGKSGHAEVIHIEYDSHITNFDNLLDVFYRMHDPTTKDQQGYDIGTQYRSVIFYHNKVQLEQAQKIIDTLNTQKVFKTPIVTELSPFTTFYAAEEYHQNYYEKKYDGAAGPICHFLKDV